MLNTPTTKRPDAVLFAEADRGGVIKLLTLMDSQGHKTEALRQFLVRYAEHVRTMPIPFSFYL